MAWKSICNVYGQITYEVLYCAEMDYDRAEFNIFNVAYIAFFSHMSVKLITIWFYHRPQWGKETIISLINQSRSSNGLNRAIVFAQSLFPLFQGMWDALEHYFLSVKLCIQNWQIIQFFSKIFKNNNFLLFLSHFFKHILCHFHEILATTQKAEPPVQCIASCM